VLIIGPPVVDELANLGYPAYLLDILGIWKLLGASAVLAPGLPRLKEWAYAGILFELTGAIASSIKRGVGLGNLVAPGLFVVCTLASWALRPPSRTFASRSFSAPTELGPAEISI